MLKLLNGDIYKMLHSIGFRVMVALSILFGVVGFVSLAYAGTFDPMQSNLGGVDAFYAHFVDARILLLVFAGVFSGLYIGEDFTCRTFQGEIASGNCRPKVLLSKTIVFLLGIFTMIVIQKSIVIAGATIVNGFGADITGVVIGNMLRAALMFMLQIGACSMICVLTSVMLKNKASIIATNFMILVLIDAMFQMMSTVSAKVLAFYIKTPLMLSLTSSIPTIPQPELVLSIIIGLLTMFSLFIASNCYFLRCELK